MLLEFTTGITLCIIFGILVGILVSYLLLKQKLNPKSKAGVATLIAIIILFSASAFFSKVTIVNMAGHQSYYCLGNLNYSFANGTKFSFDLSPMNYYLINDTNEDLILQEVWYEPTANPTALAMKLPQSTCIQTEERTISYFMTDTPPDRLNNARPLTGSSYQKKYWIRFTSDFLEEFSNASISEPKVVEPE